MLQVVTDLTMDLQGIPDGTPQVDKAIEISYVRKRKRGQVEEVEEDEAETDEDPLSINQYLSPQGRRIARKSNGEMSRDIPAPTGAPVLNGRRRSSAFRAPEVQRILKPRPGEGYVTRPGAAPMPRVGSSFENATEISKDAPKRKTPAPVSGGPRPRNDLGGTTYAKAASRHSIAEPTRGISSTDSERPSKKTRKAHSDDESVMAHLLDEPPSSPRREAFRPKPLHRKHGQIAGQQREIQLLEQSDGSSTPPGPTVSSPIHVKLDFDRRSSNVRVARSRQYDPHANRQSDIRRPSLEAATQPSVPPGPFRVQVPDTGSEGDSGDELAGPSEYAHVRSVRTTKPSRELAQVREPKRAGRESLSLELQWVLWQGQFVSENGLKLGLLGSTFCLFVPTMEQRARLFQRTSLEELDAQHAHNIVLLHHRPIGDQTDTGKTHRDKTFMRFSDWSEIEELAAFLHKHACRVNLQAKLYEPAKIAYKNATATTFQELAETTMSRGPLSVKVTSIPPRAEQQAPRKLRDKLQGEGENSIVYQPGRIDATLQRAANKNRDDAFLSKLREGSAPSSASATTVDVVQSGGFRRPRSGLLHTRSTSYYGDKTLSDDEFDDMIVSSIVPDSRRYSKTHGLGDPWKHPLEYRTNRGRSQIDFSDLERLDEGEFLNDNVIEFYMRYLFDSKPELAQRVYIFNTYFYTTLTKGQSFRKINYDSVKRWTRNVDLFSYDYIVVPVNEAFHWYLAIISNVSDLARRLRGPGGQIDAPRPMDVDEQVKPAKLDDSDAVQLLPDQVVRAEHQIERIPSPVQANAHIHDAATSVQDCIIVTPTHTSSGNGVFQHRSDNPVGDQSHNDSGTNGEIRQAIDQSEVDPMSDVQNTDIVVSDLPDFSREAEAHDDFLIQLPGSMPIDNRSSQPREPAAESSLKKPKKRSKTYDPRTVAFITLDSLGSTHPAAVSSLKHYITEEAAYKKGLLIERNELQGVTGKGIPEQNNFSDCGLYLLLYFEKFLEDPKTFVTKVLQQDLDPVNDWQRYPGPSVMRHEIRDILFKLHDEQEAATSELMSSRKASLSRIPSSPSNLLLKSIEIESETALADKAGPRKGDNMSQESTVTVPARTQRQRESASPLPSTRAEALRFAQTIEADQGHDEIFSAGSKEAHALPAKPTTDTPVVSQTGLNNRHEPRDRRQAQVERTDQGEAVIRPREEDDSPPLQLADLAVYVPRRNENNDREAEMHLPGSYPDKPDSQEFEIARDKEQRHRSKYFPTESSQVEPDYEHDRPITRGKNSGSSRPRTYSQKSRKRRSDWRAGAIHRSDELQPNEHEIITLD